MGELHQAALLIQDAARDLSAELRAGLSGDPEYIARATDWVEQRLRLLTIPPSDGADALACCNSLAQIAAKLAQFRDHPEALQVLIGYLENGVEALASGLENMTGATREELGLFKHHAPPGGLN